MSELSDKELSARLTALTRDMILIRSTVTRPEERARCFQFLRIQLESLEGVVIREFEKNGYGSMLAMPRGIDSPEVLFCGHLDVIDHPRLPQYESHVEDGRIYGPGAGDMKGANAIMLEVFRDLQKRFPGISVGLAITSDEEQGGESGLQFLVEEIGLRCKQAIIPDGGSLNDLTIEEKGILHLRVKSQGHAAHAARPWLATNALEQLMVGIQRVKAYFDEMKPADYDAEEGPSDHWFPTCAITELCTDNETPNRIPAEAEAVLDVRFPPVDNQHADLKSPPATWPATADSMRRQIAKLLGESLQLETIIQAEPTHLAPDPLFKQTTETVTGEPVNFVKACGGSDSRFLREHGIAVNLSRPVVGNLHGKDEWIDIASMVTYYRICEQYFLEKLGSS